MMRRIVGIAKVADIAGIADPAARSRVEEQALAMGRRLVIERHRFAAIEEVSALARASASLERFPHDPAAPRGRH